MKYPKQQFEILKGAMKTLAPLIDLKTVNKHSLHFIIFEQFSKGHEHNWLYCIPGGTLAKGHQISDLTGCRKLIETDFDFQLYPEGTNDSHIETAMKQAYKDLGI